MDSKELAEVGYVGRRARELEALIDPESSKKNDEQDQQQLSKFDEVREREAKLDERAVQLQKKTEELNKTEEELKSKDVSKKDEHLWTEMHEGFLKTQESVQNLQTQVGSLAKEFSQIPLSSQSSAAGGMETEMPRTTTALSPVIVILFQPATHSHSVVVHGDHQGNQVVCSGAATRPIVPAPLPAYHSTQITFVPCEQRIQVVHPGAEPLAPAAYHSTGLITPQPESGNGCGTSSSSGDGRKEEQHS